MVSDLWERLLIKCDARWSYPLGQHGAGWSRRKWTLRNWRITYLLFQSRPFPSFILLLQTHPGWTQPLSVLEPPRARQEQKVLSRSILNLLSTTKATQPPTKPPTHRITQHICCPSPLLPPPLHQHHHHHHQVDHDYVLASSSLLLKAGVPDLHLLTSQGSNPDSYFLYPSTKGRVEEAVRSMPNS